MNAKLAVVLIALLVISSPASAEQLDIFRSITSFFSLFFQEAQVIPLSDQPPCPPDCPGNPAPPPVPLPCPPFPSCPPGSAPIIGSDGCSQGCQPSPQPSNNSV